MTEGRDDTVTIAIQGEAGSFSHAAALRMVGARARALACASLELVFDAVAGGRAELGVVPVENSLAGSIHESYDLLRSHPLHVVGETTVRVRHCLIASPAYRLKDIRRVASHPVALAQCRRFFAGRPSLCPVVAEDTAGSVRALMEGRLEADAAIAGALAAELYGARVLEDGIEDHPENYTRFVAVARTPVAVYGAAKLSLVLTLPHVPGSLHRALGVLAGLGLNLTKLESRPMVGRPWEYVFYLDVEADRPALERAGREIATVAATSRVLGIYPVALTTHDHSSVTAPRLLLDTSRAYLASTPEV